MEIKNSKELDKWLFDRAQIEGHKLDSIQGWVTGVDNKVANKIINEEETK